MSNIKVKNNSVILSEKIKRPSSFFYYMLMVASGIISAIIFILIGVFPALGASFFFLFLGGFFGIMESVAPLDQGKKFFKIEQEKYYFYHIYEKYMTNKSYYQAVEDFVAELKLLGESNFVTAPWVEIFRDLNDVMQEIESEEKVKTEKIDRPDYARLAKDAHDFYQGRIIK